MIKYAAVPVIAFLAACSAEVESNQAADADRIETLSVNNLVITGANTVSTDTATQEVPPVQPAQTAAPVAESRTAQTSPAEQKQKAVRKPSTEAAAKPAPKPKAAPAADPKAEPNTPASTCTPQHREMAHC